MNSVHKVLMSKDLIPAKMDGYYFSPQEDVWVLDRNNQINKKAVTDVLNDNLKEGYLNTIALFARDYSASFASKIHGAFLAFIKEEQCVYVSKASVLNFRSKKHVKDELLFRLRIFITKWYSLGYNGIASEAVQIMKTWKLVNGKPGDVVKRKEPIQGPLTDIELQEFNEGAIRAYEKKEISLFMLTMALIISHTGRRPLQVTQMKITDILKVSKEEGEIYYLLNIPRIKQGLGFREEFRTFRITKDLYELVCKQAKDSLAMLSEFMGRQLTTEESKDVPLFISKNKIGLIDKSVSLDFYLKTDVLHHYRGKLTEVLKVVIKKENVFSERTGESLHINARRFRYTLGTRAAREGYGEFIIAELLDHSTIKSVGVYVQNHVDNAYKIDKTMGQALTGISCVFRGEVKRKEDIEYDITPDIKIKNHAGEDTGSCKQCSTCSANVPIPCYTCMHFTPWLDGPHEKVYQYLIGERERIYSITNDSIVTESLDRTIIAVKEVINHCNIMRSSHKGNKSI